MFKPKKSFFFLPLRQWWLSILIIFCGNTALAQMIPDQTLGTENSIVTPMETLVDQINGGAVRGTNLFHSFQEFNIDQDQSVYFIQPLQIQNILTRVTGSNPSHILGTLGVLGEANLFLINPHGIYFGENARLDIRGSFLATTADGIKLGDNGVFSATDIQHSQLLSVQPEALFTNALRNYQAEIKNQGNLTVGRNLTLNADRLILSGQLIAGENLTLKANHLLQIRDSLQSPFIAAASQNLLLQSQGQIDIFALHHPQSGLGSGGDLILRSDQQVGGDAHFWSGGNFQIEKLDGSLGDLFSPYDPIISSLGNVRFNNYIGSSLHIIAAGSVIIDGAVIITNPEIGTVGNDYLIEDVKLSNEQIVSINGAKEPTIDIRAGVNPAQIFNTQLTGYNDTDLFFNFIFEENPLSDNSPVTRADLEIGTIVFADINNLLSKGKILPNDFLAGKVLLTNNYEPNDKLAGKIELAPTLGNLLRILKIFYPKISTNLITSVDNITILTGNTKTGGSIYMDSRGEINLDGFILATAIPANNEFKGNGGNITLLAEDNININPRAFISSLGALGGEISLKSGNIISLQDSGIVTLSTNGTNNQQGGSLLISANKGIELINGAGVISHDLARIFQLLESDIANNFLFQLNNPNGLTANGLGTGIASFTLGGAKAGDLKINTNINLPTSYVSIYNTPTAKGLAGITAITNGIGDSGDLELHTNNLFIRNQAINNPNFDSDQDIGIATWTLPNSDGNGGKLNITAHKSIYIEGNQPNAEPFESTIKSIIDIIGINTGITTVTQGSGQAGDLEIHTGILNMINGASINTGSLIEGGGGGKLTVRADQVILDTNTILITGTVTAGNAGDLLLNAKQIKMINGGAIATDTAGLGNAGDLMIETHGLTMENGSRISAATLNRGRGGNIKIEALDTVFMSNSNIETATFSTSKAGDIEIRANSIILNDHSQIEAGVDPILFGNNIDTEIFLFDSKGNLLATNDISGFIDNGSISIFESYLQYNFAKTGTYILGVGAYDTYYDPYSFLVLGGNILGGNTLVKGQEYNLQVSLSNHVISNLASPILKEVEPNNTFLTPQKIDDYFMLKSDLNITSSDLIPHVSIEGDGDGTFDFYAFNAQANSLGIFDIDAAILRGGGIAGNIILEAREQISITDSEINNRVEGGGTSDITPAQIKLTAHNINLENADITASTAGIANGGNIMMKTQAREGVNHASEINLVNSRIETQSLEGATGNAGNVELNTHNLQLHHSSINTSTESEGNGGNINIIASEVFNLDHSNIEAQTVEIKTDEPTLQGDAGNIWIQTPLLSLQNQALISTATSSEGNGRNILIDAHSVFLTQGSRIEAKTQGQGSAGNIFLRVAEEMQINRSTISSKIERGAGSPNSSAGLVTLDAPRMGISNYSEISSATGGKGNAGGVELIATWLDVDASTISSAVESQAIGNGGDIKFKTDILTISNGSNITSSTAGIGNAGTVELKADEQISLSDSMVSSAVETTGVGIAGDVILQAPSIFMTNKAQVSSSTAGSGSGGEIIVMGNLLTLDQSAQLRTVTSSRSNINADAGGISLYLRDQLRLEGINTGLFANTEIGSTGNGGNIFIDPEIVIIRDGAGIGVNSEGSGTGGSIKLIAGSLTLDGKAFISAETFSTDGGDITLDIKNLLLLRYGSKISATAGIGGAGGNGGNVNINAQFIVAVPSENSDITANAFEGNGGNINITTNGIFGLKLRPELTNLSDITASSAFGLAGNVQINTPDVDPAQGIIELPSNPIDVASLIEQNFCRLGQESQFTIVGRGGLPVSPNTTLNPDAPWVDLRLEEDNLQATVRTTAVEGDPSLREDAEQPRIIQAQAWAIAPNGSIILTAEALTFTAQGIWLHPTDCQILQQP
jgi:filamentous hemagglutinin family protein